MGYYIDLTNAEWEIPETAEVLQALKESVTKYHAIKRGGSSDGESWFSWMSDEDILKAEKAVTIFNDLGFETNETDKGFTLEAYNSKTGQEDVFLAVVAPFCTDGSYVEIRGEDGAEWQYSVHDGKLHYAEVVKSFDEPHPYRYHHYDIEFDADGKMTTNSVLIDLNAENPCEGMVNRRDAKKEVNDRITYKASL
jgi:hypothetical protein